MAVFNRQTLLCNADSDAVVTVVGVAWSVVVVTLAVCSCHVVEGG